MCTQFWTSDIKRILYVFVWGKLTEVVECPLYNMQNLHKPSTTRNCCIIDHWVYKEKESQHCTKTTRTWSCTLIAFQSCYMTISVTLHSTDLCSFNYLNYRGHAGWMTTLILLNCIISPARVPKIVPPSRYSEYLQHTRQQPLLIGDCRRLKSLRMWCWLGSNWTARRLQ